VLTNYVRTAELDPEHDLLASGHVDSMGVMEIIGFVEQTFSLSVDDEDIVPENFRSLRARADYVARKKNGSGVGQAHP
jgi:acyl carrier protein